MVKILRKLYNLAKEVSPEEGFLQLNDERSFKMGRYLQVVLPQASRWQHPGNQTLKPKSLDKGHSRVPHPPSQSCHSSLRL